MSRHLFGPFEFDTATLDLRRDNASVRLQSQPAQVLKALLENPNQIVSRDQLRQTLWGDSTFVDFESGLNFCISQLRSALRDDASQPLYIRTVPKKGYQFIAPLRAAGDSAPEPEPPKPLPARRLSTAQIALIAIVLLLLATSLILILHPPRAHAAPPIVAVARFDNETGNASYDTFANNLTDVVVAQLTASSNGHARIIGNAKILFEPRPERDLRTIASSLNASYIVLGQVQSSGDNIRVLAHLIRASDQTHIWVVRIDRPAASIAPLDAPIAQQIAAEFSSRLADHPEKAASFNPGSH